MATHQPPGNENTILINMNTQTLVALAAMAGTLSFQPLARAADTQPPAQPAGAGLDRRPSKCAPRCIGLGVLRFREFKNLEFDALTTPQRSSGSPDMRTELHIGPKPR